MSLHTPSKAPETEDQFWALTHTSRMDAVTV